MKTDNIKLEIVNKILEKYDWKTTGYENDNELIEMVEEYFEEEFSKALKDELRKQILKELK